MNEVETLKAETLKSLKMLLGIEGNEQDGLLSFIISDTINLITGHCKIDIIPRQLESFVPIVAADIYRSRGYGSEDIPQSVKAVSEGERSVTFENNISEVEILKRYYERLKPFVNRKGRVPSDYDKISDSDV